MQYDRHTPHPCDKKCHSDHQFVLLLLQDCIDSRLLVELVFQPSAQCCATLDMQTLDELIMLHATMLMMQGWVHKIV